MSRRIAAVYEGGVFRPVKPVRLRNGAHVDLVIEDSVDQESMTLMKLAEQSESYSFLHEPAEDIYTINDGTPVDPL